MQYSDYLIFFLLSPQLAAFQRKRTKQKKKRDKPVPAVDQDGGEECDTENSVSSVDTADLSSNESMSVPYSVSGWM